jgi:membrane-bound serine protease (ClpP class)
MLLVRSHATSGAPAIRFRRAVVGSLFVVVALASVAGAAWGTSSPPPASRTSAAVPQPSGRRGITVVQVQGYLDPPVASLIRDAITTANRSRSTLLLMQLDSGGALDVDVASLVRLVRDSRVPIAVWVGPSGAHAKGGAALLAEAAPILFVAPGSDLGPGAPARLDHASGTIETVRAQLGASATANGRAEAATRTLATRSLGATDAGRLAVTNGVRPTIGEVIVTLDGRTVPTAAGPVRMSTARVIGTGRGRRRQPNQQVVFDSLGLGARLQHSLISPRIAYVLLVVGLALIVFEFFAASVGFAAAVGALAVLSAAYGFSHLPVVWWAAVLIAGAVAGFAIDVQAGGVGAWTVIGTAALIAGSFTLYGGSSPLRVPWWELVLVVAATLLFFVGGLPAFVRSRFSTPTIGREALVGELGEAEVAVDPDGVVMIRGSRWRARTNRATPIGAGASVRVVAVEGLVLEVEPEEGGAKDYRDRARSRRGAGNPDQGDESAPDGGTSFS